MAPTPPEGGCGLLAANIILAGAGPHPPPAGAGSPRIMARASRVRGAALPGAWAKAATERRRKKVHARTAAFFMGGLLLVRTVWPNSGKIYIEYEGLHCQPDLNQPVEPFRIAARPGQALTTPLGQELSLEQNLTRT
jgi:hypothetical protein